MEIAGNTAMWTRPDSGDSPCSYPAPTYSAVKALFESVLWGPAIVIVPTKVELCSKPRYHSYATNYGGPLRKPTSITKGDNYQLYATVLVDVCYRLYANVIPNSNKTSLPDSAKNWDKRTSSPGHAYMEIFNRRLHRGQSYGTLSLGWANLRYHILVRFEIQQRFVLTLPILRFRPCYVLPSKKDTVLNLMRYMTRKYAFIRVYSSIRNEVTVFDKRVVQSFKSNE